MLTGTVPALITPLDRQGNVMVGSARPLADYYVREQANGLYMLGWTGEGMRLTPQQRMQWAEAVLRECSGRLPVFVHVGYNRNPEDSVRLARHAAQNGAYAIASVGLEGGDLAANVAYFTALSEAAPELPFYIYWMAGSPFMVEGEKATATQVLQAMRAVPTFKGIKFTDSDFFTMEQLKKHAPQLNILTGADELAVCAGLMGADGTIGSLQGITCYHYQRMFQLMQAGDYAGARALQARANTLSEAYLPKSIGSLPAVKMILERVHGIPAGYCAAGGPYIARLEDEAVTDRLITVYRENILTAPAGPTASTSS